MFATACCPLCLAFLSPFSSSPCPFLAIFSSAGILSELLFLLVFASASPLVFFWSCIFFLFLFSYVLVYSSSYYASKCHPLGVFSSCLLFIPLVPSPLCMFARVLLAFALLFVNTGLFFILILSWSPLELIFHLIATLRIIFVVACRCHAIQLGPWASLFLCCYACFRDSLFHY